MEKLVGFYLKKGLILSLSFLNPFKIFAQDPIDVQTSAILRSALSPSPIQTKQAPKDSKEQYNAAIANLPSVDSFMGAKTSEADQKKEEPIASKEVKTEEKPSKSPEPVVDQKSEQKPILQEVPMDLDSTKISAPPEQKVEKKTPEKLTQKTVALPSAISEDDQTRIEVYTKMLNRYPTLKQLGFSMAEEQLFDPADMDKSDSYKVYKRPGPDGNIKMYSLNLLYCLVKTPNPIKSIAGVVMPKYRNQWQELKFRFDNGTGAFEPGAPKGSKQVEFQDPDSKKWFPVAKTMLDSIAEPSGEQTEFLTYFQKKYPLDYQNLVQYIEQEVQKGIVLKKESQKITEPLKNPIEETKKTEKPDEKDINISINVSPTISPQDTITTPIQKTESPKIDQEKTTPAKDQKESLTVNINQIDQDGSLQTDPSNKNVLQQGGSSPNYQGQILPTTGYGYNQSTVPLTPAGTQRVMGLPTDQMNASIINSNLSNRIKQALDSLNQLLQNDYDEAAAKPRIMIDKLLVEADTLKAESYINTLNTILDTLTLNANLFFQAIRLGNPAVRNIIVELVEKLIKALSIFSDLETKAADLYNFDIRADVGQFGFSKTVMEVLQKSYTIFEKILFNHGLICWMVITGNAKTFSDIMQRSAHCCGASGIAGRAYVKEWDKSLSMIMVNSLNNPNQSVSNTATWGVIGYSGATAYKKIASKFSSIFNRLYAIDLKSSGELFPLVEEFFQYIESPEYLAFIYPRGFSEYYANPSRFSWINKPNSIEATNNGFLKYASWFFAQDTSDLNYFGFEIVGQSFLRDLVANWTLYLIKILVQFVLPEVNTTVIETITKKGDIVVLENKLRCKITCAHKAAISDQSGYVVPDDQASGSSNITLATTTRNILKDKSTIGWLDSTANFKFIKPSYQKWLEEQYGCTCSDADYVIVLDSIRQLYDSTIVAGSLSGAVSRLSQIFSYGGTGKRETAFTNFMDQLQTLVLRKASFTTGINPVQITVSGKSVETQAGFIDSSIQGSSFPFRKISLNVLGRALYYFLSIGEQIKWSNRIGLLYPNALDSEIARVRFMNLFQNLYSQSDPNFFQLAMQCFSAGQSSLFKSSIDSLFSNFSAKGSQALYPKELATYLTLLPKPFPLSQIDYATKF